MMMRALLFALPFADATQQLTSLKSDEQMNPVTKVVTLIQEMKTQVEKEGADDLEAHEKYQCWCDANDKAKTEAIDTAQQEIEELGAFIESAAAKLSELKAEIKALTTDIAEDTDALNKATALREEEIAEFEAEEADLKETLGLLSGAIATLSKVQLVQKQGGHDNVKAMSAEVNSALVEVSKKVLRRHPQFQSVMQKDLFDVIGSLDSYARSEATGALVAQGFLNKHDAVAFEQTRLLPWEKTDEQIGKEANPNDLKGAAAGAKSYNSRSGRIFGILREMGDEVARDLAESQKADFVSEVDYQKLRAAKESEIAAASEQKERKETESANLLRESDNAKKDLAVTQDNMEADQEFLSNLKKDCKEQSDNFVKRTKARADEVIALAETLKILTEDAARTNFGKTLSFLQVSQGSGSLAALQDRLSNKVMNRLVQAAKKTGNWALASLAVRVRLDAFTKVKEAMDKMLKELDTQQKEEYARWESCKSDIDKTEDKIWEANNTRDDLADKHKQLSNSVKTLAKEIVELKEEEKETEVSLKKAGEQRKAENALFQVAVMDQRTAINILNKAKARLEDFYTFAQQPGAAIAPPPPKGKAYQKSGGASGVLQLIMKIITDAEVEEQDLKMSEQRSQTIYSEYVADTKNVLEKNRKAQEEKTAQHAEDDAERLETEEAQSQNFAVLKELHDLLTAHHLDCDYLLKYFDIRQQSRAEEMDAIKDAKAILSGADFGN